MGAGPAAGASRANGQGRAARDGDGASGGHVRRLRELKRAGADIRAAAVAVGAREGRHARADLAHDAAADDGGGNHQSRIATIEGQCAVVGDGAGAEKAARASVADLQSAAADGRSAGVGVVAGEDNRARAGGGERGSAAGATAADFAGNGEAVGAVVRGDRGVAGKRDGGGDRVVAGDIDGRAEPLRVSEPPPSARV